ncbi:MAG: hypothetical protein UU40_C0004G0019 [Candidatus Uhrbacteria bacterium GW2011_GWD2_41_121]|uniref:Uncharacterized protein n=1 Tax=Candidatus Uhrbacteria bacterium GW2011_GWC1_41_20 TaxID=1618983 RepID=A0A0G0VFS3_9BACT|nr:MAG: hypothetical protein UT52_C0006G0019 [Candidatus Uhrbacteria bacterium GW2011_GWE1_39_46]KKR64229.1 MAG: hypothetical protein UU04_C0004G0019 [Candidatus Uhrbacteria bacterium GW2011_GWC2_40_450]KKR90362.1 MAG: hypothetical protein UU40_C0004G0019 [Candidatus Uhrbacteria bacterium GW2011_GWD2_41_121]KKR96265.1 MAG: hypothetical protein UU46_C0005G0019 [Candidatus Uhrbacteria bacterium GW2011_GWD1_41_16]KKR99638.1 MAG: hypothetical protein UU50_C0004G0019 [Candidatus Uhrbacteria bacteriu
MLETSDILYIVLAFCALWITAFICWFVYQIAVMLKRVNDLVAELKFQIEKVEHLLDAIHGKFEEGGEHLGSLVEHVKTYISSKTNK